MGMKTWLDGQLSIPLLRAALRLDAPARDAEAAPAQAPADAEAGEKPKRRLALPFLGGRKRKVTEADATPAPAPAEATPAREPGRLKTWLDGQLSIPLLRSALRLDAPARDAGAAPAQAPADAEAEEKPKRGLALPFLGGRKRKVTEADATPAPAPAEAEEKPRRKLHLAFRLPLLRRRRRTDEGKSKDDDVLEVFRGVGMEPIKKAPLAPKAAAVADAIAAPAPVPAMRTVEEPKLVPWRKGEQPQAGDGAAAPDANKAAAAAAPPVTPPPAAPAQQAAGNAAKAPATASTGQPASAPAPADGKPAAADPLGNTTAVAKAPAPAADDDDEDEEEEDEKKSGGNDLLDLFTDETGVGSDLKDLAATLEELDIKELLELCREVAGNIKVRYGQ